MTPKRAIIGLIIITILCFIAVRYVNAAEVPRWVKDAELHLAWNAVTFPPHNEAVVAGKVARYRLQATPSVEFKYFKYSLQVDAWGVNTWQPSSVVGNGIQNWDQSDWSVEEWRLSTLQRVQVGSSQLHLYVEAYMPISRDSDWSGGHGMETEYYNGVGVGGMF